MRKISVAIVLSLLAITFFGCGGKKINSPTPCWNYLEEYTYDMEYKPKDTDLTATGEYKIIVELVNKSEAKCGDYTIADFYGTKVTTRYSIDIEGVTNTMETVSYITNKLQSSLSYYKYDITANETYKIAENKMEISAKYVAKKYTYKIGDAETTIKIGKKLAVDNNALYTILRAYDILNSTITANYFVPNPYQNTLTPLLIRMDGESKIDALGGEINTVCTQINLNEELSGSPILVYYSKEPIKHEATGAELKKVIVKFIEFDTTYRLKSIDNVKVSRV